MSDDAVQVASPDDAEALREVLFGRSVVSVEMNPRSAERVGWIGPAQGVVTLDDGTRLLLAGNDGGCSCGAGDYELTRLNDMPVNGITNVVVRVDGDSDAGEQVYSVFVLAQDEQLLELAAFEGDDGNGYYGTGFWFSIVQPDDRSAS